jgi:ABC-2 type transport system permease protein
MKNSFLRVLLALTGLVVLNLLASYFPVRWDMTEDKRYTLSEASKNLMRTLDQPVSVEVYLTGDLPPGFKRLENAARETLEELRSESNGKLLFEFIDPSSASSEEQRQKQYGALVEKGLIPTNVFANEDGKRTEKIVFPSAFIRSDTLGIPVQLLKGNSKDGPQEQLNQSYEGVEFELAAAIRQLVQPERKKIGLVVSHTQIAPSRLSDLIATLQEHYDVFLDVNNPDSYDGLDALLVLKPDVSFSEEEKYKLDQYIVGGGKGLFFVDGVRVDSVSLEGTFAQALDLNLGDLFFGWGVRINANLVKDLNAALIPLNVGNQGEQPKIEPLPWRFFPLLNNFGDHPISRNIDAIYSRFLSSIDTVSGASELKKTPLLMTSPYTRLLTAPVLVAYNEARQQPPPTEYASGVKLAAVVLEGKFNSLFQNRIFPSDPRSQSFVSAGHGGKVLICSDGDVVVNEMDYKRNVPLPLGYDRVSKNIFGNKDFILHAIDYLTDENGLITARNKQVSIRQLNKVRIQEERTQWKLLNLVVPVAIVLLFGAGRFFWRRKRFG